MMKPRKILLATGLTVYLLQSLGCGVLLYPERQGQKGGRIDPLVAILDGVGLFLFVIPGLVAFAIDFYQGTIYLPGGYSSLTGEREPLRALKLEGPVTPASVKAALERELGREVDLSQAQVQALHLERDRLQLIQTLALHQQTRTAL